AHSPTSTPRPLPDTRRRSRILTPPPATLPLTLSLHDALPISAARRRGRLRAARAKSDRARAPGDGEVAARAPGGLGRRGVRTGGESRAGAQPLLPHRGAPGTARVRAARRARLGPGPRRAGHGGGGGARRRRESRRR